MTVLSDNILCNHGPYVNFADLPTGTRLDYNELNDPVRFRDNIFFSFADVLIELYCAVTCSYVFFDPHISAVISKPYELLRLSANFLSWSHQITLCREGDLNKILHDFDIYRDSGKKTRPSGLYGEDLRIDLVDTALYISRRIMQMAKDKRVLVIDSI